MKKLIIIIIILPLFCLGQFNIIDAANKELPILTKNMDNTIFLELNSLFITTIQETKPCNINLIIPFLKNENLKLDLEYFEVFTEDFQVARTTDANFIVTNYSPSIVSYKIQGENNISGSVSILKNRFIGVIKKDGGIYEIAHIEDNIYALVDVNDAIAEFNFTCQTNTKDVIPNNILESENTSGALCLNMAIDIDYYTYSEFNYNCNDAVEWVLAVLTGVSEIYMLDLNVLVQASYVHVWESINDPYSGDDMYDYLNDLEDTWTSSWNFNAVDRDIVHLFTKQNVGGGLANMDALCSNWQGY
ncbi:MAG: M12 family metallo-peptidase, partial [Candidatus Marinimicrobia bacterium]|nr:M12 family metallo-peptidase [Candidatus Neomarinimicrobiota bacterium]